MAKLGYSTRRKRAALLGLLLLPLLYAALLRCDVSLRPLWRLQVLSRRKSSTAMVRNNLRSNDTTTTVHGGRDDTAATSHLLYRLVRGKALRDLSRNGVSCISDPESDLCITTSPVRIATGSPATRVYLSASGNSLLEYSFRPYPRKTDPVAMARTSPVTLLSSSAAAATTSPPPPCDVTHDLPAVLFSTGGFSGNFFHDINDLIIPLFLTAGHLRSRALLLVTDLQPWWARKYRRVLRGLSAYDVVPAASSPVVHCFPAAVVGLKYHGNLACNTSEAPGGVSTLDFRRFLRGSLSLSISLRLRPAAPVQLVLISRRSSRSRVLLNEGAAVEQAEMMGFRVAVATPEKMSRVERFAAEVNGCQVLMGVHGAGLTNMVFLPQGAVVLQVVPWGLDWASAAYYGRPARRMGLRYVEYHTAVEESTLYREYPREHPVLADPWSVNLRGYNVSRPVYTDGQNVTLDLTRFRVILLQVIEQLRNPSPLE